MGKEYFVIRGGKVVYSPGHYLEKDAVNMAKAEIKKHPKSLVHVVKIVSSWVAPNDPSRS